MEAEQRGAFLSALFVDYDNVYLSLRRRSEEAAARFAQTPTLWMEQIVSGRLVRRRTGSQEQSRRLAVNRVYGNPVPRRAGRENDPNSFIFVRHHFIRAGFEVVDCPPLTAQLKNGSDTRMAIDVRDLIEHRTRFDEFILLSGDADFTPVLHRLREYDRATVIYANDHTAQPYTALCDGRIEENDLVKFLLSEALPTPAGQEDRGVLSHTQPRSETERAVGQAVHQAIGYDQDDDQIASGLPQSIARGQTIAAGTSQDSQRSPAPEFSPEEPTIRALRDDFRQIGEEILELVVKCVGEAEKPVPIAYLANRAMKEIGHAKTVGTNWAGCGGFLNFLSQNLPDRLRLTEAPPHSVYDPARHRLEGSRQEEQRQSGLQRQASPARNTGNLNSNRFADLQNSITRIYEASKAPPLPPSEYQLLFSLISADVNENGFQPGRTTAAVLTRAEENGVRFAEQDVAFVISSVDDVDPRLEHSRTAAAIARNYRDVILARCQRTGLELTDDEHQLIEVWFGGAQWASAGTPSAAPPDDRPERDRMQDMPRPDIPLPSDFDEGDPDDLSPREAVGERGRKFKRER